MDSVKPALLFLALADGSLLTGFLRALADAGMPHTPTELGTALGTALFFLVSQLLQARAAKKRTRRMVAEAIAGHLPTLSTSLPDGVQPLIPSLDGTKLTTDVRRRKRRRA